MKTSRIALGVLVFGLAAAFAVPACSRRNQEGPDVTCEDLECGRINACQDGIIAQCADGKNVRWHACPGDRYVCDATWQIPGEFRCDASATDCEGCRPEKDEGCADDGSGGDGGGGSPADGGGGSGASGGDPSGGGGGTGGGTAGGGGA
jgi:hypothetical protein